jgi:hypothetical protein
MTRETSRKAYQELLASGKLKGQLADLLEDLVDMGPGGATIAETVDGTKYAVNLNLTRARFTDLMQRGLIREISTRRCKITGKQALVWEYTGRTKPLGDTRKHVKTDAKRWKAIARSLYAEAMALAEECGEIELQEFKEGPAATAFLSAGGVP